MAPPSVSLVYRNGAFTLPARYAPPPDRFDSTDGDNVAELAGRVCYDSINADRPGRPSALYHKHLLGTGHLSVYAHAVETFEVRHVDGSAPRDLGHLLWDVTDALHCRPGVWVTKIGARSVRFAVSLRAVIEWHQHGPEYDVPTDDGARLYRHVYEALRPAYPLALAAAPVPTADRFRPAVITVAHVAPELPKEQWCSLYIDGVSRDLLQELVRHHWQANPSVESTRYVDKSATGMVLHPALEDPRLQVAAAVVREEQARARETYARVFDALTAAGVDKKTARGAARSCLPGATDTKLVFSLSLFQARHLLKLRLDQTTGTVDPEIGRLAAAMREVLLTVWPEL